MTPAKLEKNASNSIERIRALVRAVIQTLSRKEMRRFDLKQVRSSITTSTKATNKAASDPQAINGSKSVIGQNLVTSI